jgi:hypothetical protein
MPCRCNTLTLLGCRLTAHSQILVEALECFLFSSLHGLPVRVPGYRSRGRDVEQLVNESLLGN